MDRLTMFGDRDGVDPRRGATRLVRHPLRIPAGRATVSEKAPPAQEAINPLGQIPTIVLPDGGVMTESAAITLWLAISPAAMTWCRPDEPNAAVSCDGSSSSRATSIRPTPMPTTPRVSSTSRRCAASRRP
jgi:hypothetical protein